MRLVKIVLILSLLLSSCNTTEESSVKSTKKNKNQNKVERVEELPSPKTEAKVNKSLTTGPLKNVTTALSGDPGLEGFLPTQMMNDLVLSLDDFAKREPDNISAMITYMGILRIYEQVGQQKNIEEKTGILGGGKNPWFLLEAGYSALKQRDFSKANYYFEKALKIGDTNPLVKAAVTHAIGVKLYLENKTQLGIFQMKKAATGNAPFLPAQLTLGFLGLKSGDYVGALQMFRSALSVAPNSMNANLGLAAALRGNGKADEALPIMQRLYKQRANDRRIVWNYALVLSSLGGANQKTAADILNKYFQLPGSYPDIDAKANTLMNKLMMAQPPVAPAGNG